jgi:alpha-methylacyl-CoA racemase
MPHQHDGPLRDVKVVELASLAPAPFAAGLLADMGADVVRVDRIGPRAMFSSPMLDRGKRSIAVDLKKPEGVEVVLDLVGRAHILVEGWRPGVAERLGLGPEACLARRRSLVYGRMTGFGQSGPMALRAGHDINYISLSGVLGRIGRAGQPPTPPINLVGDFGGGSMYLLFGVLCALHEARHSGVGQVVDASMVEGSAHLMLPFFSSTGPAGPYQRGTGLLDTGAPFYETYETADGRWMAVGAIEPQFYAALLDGLGLDAADLPSQHDSQHWAATKDRFAAAFLTRTRDEWEAKFAGTDACVTPVLELDEVAEHPHNAARNSFGTHDGAVQPEPAPKLSVTPGAVGGPPPEPGQHTAEVLSEWLGLDPETSDAMLRDATVA